MIGSSVDPDRFITEDLVREVRFLGEHYDDLLDTGVVGGWYVRKRSVSPRRPNTP